MIIYIFCKLTLYNHIMKKNFSVAFKRFRHFGRRMLFLVVVFLRFDITNEPGTDR